ncbi:LLM class flavin-dependent oxidoreductase [Bradyrhizobium sp. U87765 SZCCT0131]|uniref:LLM class flavin-dependent oxidoreductase n=1 Tax=unclassified Bradyrhizobium TaxID=2631580 RepID=UPI001BA79DC6|nr:MULTISPECIES: LLM class flavin-dependent oxidoreductase [unclassified Bradyrhizobium]MBR1217873.1 LLM class flavin-dependent oxidoreductase [Bradyrhizobium sp. U87765 SZCCT0131]MBR1261181.1 LLM class flavin-dependent oxidoreductase [Bradyrhizobium sp. U87765 SZCCT0134]MBR1303371.1 LLM class flavin-dependent oxidoreductase [Bradyrhizobium sp. U87765 SZCCT0110]MBR1318977.1 LLM class flavin-dependent oxidoreductase [Bradyrhizobium sp. U87765 SZCCT0109]MBR1347302.1 LLM class flavin-dependent ox
MALSFGFWSEQETQVGHSYARRLHELVDEVRLAEKMGFDCVALSEQHVALGGISSSAPEVVYGYLAAVTSRVKLRSAVTLMPQKINHALRSAERLAVTDILSHGRMEFYAGRANTTIAMRAFNVDPNETLAQMEEGIALLKKSMREDIFTFEGKYYQIPPRMLVPKPIQKPHPVIGIAATSERSHGWAGAEGLAVMSASIYQGWEVQDRLLNAYRRAWKRDEQGPLERPRIGLPLFFGIGATDQKAKDDYAEPLMHYARISTDAYPRLARLADDYAYMSESVPAMERAGRDWDYLLNHSATTVCGSPDTVIRQIEKFQALGIDEVLLHLDSVSHEKIMEAIDMCGRYIIPHFNDKNNVVRPTEDILAQIRAMRPQQ